VIASWRAWRDRRTLQRRPIPDDLWQLTLQHYPFLARLSAADGSRLREMSTLFLARKEFSGTHGLSVTDEMAVAVAAQACLPVLELGLDWYDGFVGIVMHPGEMLAKRSTTDDDGVVHEYDELLSGEAVAGGPVTMSWQDVSSGAETMPQGYNVVVHEFAHVLDMRDGLADGVPPIADRTLRDDWQREFEAAYLRFCDELDAGIDTWLDPYGAQAPEEFFAVCSEAFFVAPHELRARFRRLYDVMQRFFKQDPMAWPG
jgi:Mlc titration factor MtfA (ptsG expression regulator)